MRKCQSFIGQGVGNDIIFAVDVMHGPVNPARSECMTELDARSEVRPQIGRATSSLPAAEDNYLPRDDLRIQFKDHALVNVGPAERAFHTHLQTFVFCHVAGVSVRQDRIFRTGGRTCPRVANLPERSCTGSSGARPHALRSRSVLAVEHSVVGRGRRPETDRPALSS